ncbi:TPA: hypothetical protein HA372_04515 [Candidatus Woesearchaeota archaeon]|nr:hypothetical protein [Candidatus Woesearchaeota archaeon]
MRTVITEGRAKVEEFLSPKISKELPVFYNPAMALNRDISVLLLRALGKKRMRVADILAGSGVRGIRLLRELGKGAIESMAINDGSKDAARLIKKNLILNGLGGNKKITVMNKDANLVLLESSGFDYIDIDPFGSPVPFLDAACRRISGGGILAVTATDTAPLCGTYPKTCRRRYWAAPKKCGMMHELGLRILIRRVQLIGAQYEKSLVPVFCYAREHYFRAFFACGRGNAAVDEMMERHGMLDGVGPLWLGPLWEPALAKKMDALARKEVKAGKEMIRLLDLIREEADVPAAGFHDIHELGRGRGRNIPSREQLISAIRKAGYRASGTHFKGEGIRTTMPQEKLLALMQ